MERAGGNAIGKTAPPGRDPAGVAPPDPEAERMLRVDIEGRGIRDERVLRALRETPRRAFVPAGLQAEACGDYPLPIGFGQTISQPYIVAYMTELAAPQPDDVALEIGTGSGYQTAVLAKLARWVYSLEIRSELAAAARERLERLGVANVTLAVGDGYRGWPERAPFDVILVTAAPEAPPDALIEQLKPGGRLVIPVGPEEGPQELELIRKTAEGRISVRRALPVRFVPMVRP